MNKKLVVIGAIVLFLSIGLSGCTDDKGMFIGTWSNGDVTLTFSDNGNCALVKGAESYTGAWDISDGKLGLDWFGEVIVFDYMFTNDDKTLKLNRSDDGSEFLVLTKQ